MSPGALLRSQSKMQMSLLFQNKDAKEQEQKESIAIDMEESLKLLTFNKILAKGRSGKSKK